MTFTFKWRGVSRGES